MVPDAVCIFDIICLRETHLIEWKSKWDSRTNTIQTQCPRPYHLAMGE